MLEKRKSRRPRFKRPSFYSVLSRLDSINLKQQNLFNDIDKQNKKSVEKLDKIGQNIDDNLSRLQKESDMIIGLQKEIKLKPVPSPFEKVQNLSNEELAKELAKQSEFKDLHSNFKLAIVPEQSKVIVSKSSEKKENETKNFPLDVLEEENKEVDDDKALVNENEKEEKDLEQNELNVVEDKDPDDIVEEIEQNSKEQKKPSENNLVNKQETIDIKIKNDKVENKNQTEDVNLKTTDISTNVLSEKKKEEKEIQIVNVDIEPATEKEKESSLSPEIIEKETPKIKTLPVEKKPTIMENLNSNSKSGDNLNQPKEKYVEINDQMQVEVSTKEEKKETETIDDPKKKSLEEKKDKMKVKNDQTPKAAIAEEIKIKLEDAKDAEVPPTEIPEPSISVEAVTSKMNEEQEELAKSKKLMDQFLGSKQGNPDEAPKEVAKLNELGQLLSKLKPKVGNLGQSIGTDLPQVNSRFSADSNVKGNSKSLQRKIENFRKKEIEEVSPSVEIQSEPSEESGFDMFGGFGGFGSDDDGFGGFDLDNFIEKPQNEMEEQLAPEENLDLTKKVPALSEFPTFDQFLKGKTLPDIPGLKLPKTLKEIKSSGEEEEELTKKVSDFVKELSGETDEEGKEGEPKEEGEAGEQADSDSSVTDSTDSAGEEVANEDPESATPDISNADTPVEQVSTEKNKEIVESLNSTTIETSKETGGTALSSNDSSQETLKTIESTIETENTAIPLENTITIEAPIAKTFSKEIKIPTETLKPKPLLETISVQSKTPLVEIKRSVKLDIETPVTSKIISPIAIKSGLVNSKEKIITKERESLKNVESAIVTPLNPIVQTISIGNSGE